MYQVCKFDPITDIEPVSSNGGIDINAAIMSGSISASDSVASFNGISEPDSICGRCEDVFDAIDRHRAISKVKSSVSPESGQTE